MSSKFTITTLQLTNTMLLVFKWGPFFKIFIVIYVFSLLPSNFIVPGVKSSKICHFLILNLLLFGSLSY